MHRRIVLGITAVLIVGASVLVTQPSASAQPPALTFTALGDISASPQAAGTLTAVHDIGGALTLAIGDMSYGVTGQERAWCDFVTTKTGAGAGYPFELISGNHESNGQNGNINDFSACLPNQLPGLVGTYGREWYVDVPANSPVARFVMITPALTFPTSGLAQYTAGSAHYNWTAAAIDGARAKAIPWVVVGMHKPCVSLGEYVCDPGVALTDLLLQKKVDLVLTGHEHLYERTKQLALSGGCPSLVTGTYQPACVADSDNQLTKDAGTVFATVGTGGVGLRDVNADDTEAGYFAASSGANSNPTWGALKVDLTADSLTAAFVRGAGGTFADGFTISRGATPPPNSPPTAAFAAPVCTVLNCAFDGSTSTDTDGTIASYAWAFGDGATGSGPTTSHAYAVPGTYSTTLTVTDDDGATATASRSVTVTAPSGVFTETFPGADGTPWPSAWTTAVGNGTATQNAGTGALTFNDVANAHARAQLVGSAARADADLLMSYRWTSTTPNGYFNVWLRGSTWNGSYRPRDGYGIQLSSSSTGVTAAKSVAGTVTTLASTANAQTVTTAKQWLRLRVVGTTIQYRIWTDGQPEPTTWKATLTDTAVTSPGQLFLSYNRSSSNTGAKTVAVDDVTLAPGQ